MKGNFQKYNKIISFHIKCEDRQTKILQDLKDNCLRFGLRIRKGGISINKLEKVKKGNSVRKSVSIWSAVKWTVGYLKPELREGMIPDDVLGSLQS